MRLTTPFIPRGPIAAVALAAFLLPLPVLAEGQAKLRPEAGRAAAPGVSPAAKRTDDRVESLSFEDSVRTAREKGSALPTGRRTVEPLKAKAPEPSQGASPRMEEVTFVYEEVEVRYEPSGVEHHDDWRQNGAQEEESDASQGKGGSGRDAKKE